MAQWQESNAFNSASKFLFLLSARPMAFLGVKPPSDDTPAAAAAAAAAAAGLQEVHFSGGKSERLSSLRHEKRYKVPESPLLQVRTDTAVNHRPGAVMGLLCCQLSTLGLVAAGAA
jgi:hypothetical protein